MLERRPTRIGNALVQTQAAAAGLGLTPQERLAVGDTPHPVLKNSAVFDELPPQLPQRFELLVVSR